MTTPKNPKSHAKKACDYCKQRHIKCDGKLPCHQCERRGRSCDYSFKSEKRGPKRKHLSSSTPDNFSNEVVLPDKRSKREFNTPQEISLSTIKLQSDTSWSYVYQRTVSPFSSAESSNVNAGQIQRLLQADHEKLQKASIESLSEALEQLSIVSHGSRYCYHFDISKKAFDQALRIVEVIFNKPFTQKKYAQKLASNMELLNYYCIGSGDYYKARMLTTNAHFLLNNYGNSILPSTIHRIYTFLLGKTTDLIEVDFWLRKAQNIKMGVTTFSEVSAWVVMVMNLTHPMLAHGGSGTPLPNCNLNLSQREFEHKICVLQLIDESEKVVDFYERMIPPTDFHGLKVCKIYRQVIYGLRSIVLSQCKFANPALAYAAKAIDFEKPDLCILPYSTSLAYACQVAKFFGKNDLLFKGLSVLDELSYQYPALQEFVKQLREDTNFVTKVTEISSDSPGHSIDEEYKQYSEDSSDKQQEPSTTSTDKEDMATFFAYGEEGQDLYPFLADDCIFEKDEFYQSDFFVNL